MNLWQSILPSYKLFGQNQPSLAADVGPEPDGVNEISFGVVADPQVVAQTTVWGVFSGPISQRQIIEADTIFNTNQPFSSIPNSIAYYFKDIVVHEFGHTIGLADVKCTACTSGVMYEYASLGETTKNRFGF